jgi:hypothetical protein
MAGTIKYFLHENEFFSSGEIDSIVVPSNNIQSFLPMDGFTHTSSPTDKIV